jgi:hypothetical protein
MRVWSETRIRRQAFDTKVLGRVDADPNPTAVRFDNRDDDIRADANSLAYSP